MKIQIERLNDAVHLEARNEQGNTIQLDGSPDVGGKDLGFRPMQLLLAAVGSCASMDLIHILTKQRQVIKSYKVEVDGERVKEGDVSLFRQIHVRFILEGDLDPAKVERAVKLSMEKYCSVSKTLEPTANITYEFKINA